jgi:hypothetical protein
MKQLTEQYKLEQEQDHGTISNWPMSDIATIFVNPLRGSYEGY